jgi:glycine/D-amino acid oxidase-like deaminating enzyme
MTGERDRFPRKAGGRSMRVKRRRVVVIGAGIVGCSLAAELAKAQGVRVTVLERGSPHRLPGSTSHAPGFVGILGESAVMTDLARISAGVFDSLGTGSARGFFRVGALRAHDFVCEGVGGVL